MPIVRWSAELKLPDGEVWRNIVTEEKSVVAQTLAQFRGNYKYNWLDANFRAFHAEVPMFAQWDDHEVTNDWAPVGTADETGYAEDGSFADWWRGRAARSTNSCRCARRRARDGRIYRRIAYGPLLDIFLIDMRSYRDSTCNKRDDRSDSLHPRGGATGVAEARTGGVERDLEGDRRRHADRI